MYSEDDNGHCRSFILSGFVTTAGVRVGEEALRDARMSNEGMDGGGK